MTLEQAKELLNTLHRGEMKDNSVGDKVVCWHTVGDSEEMLATGYFGSKASDVLVYGDRARYHKTDIDEFYYAPEGEFQGAEALELMKCGAKV